MNLSNIRAPKKATANKKRVGRGMGSGMGKTSTRGHKGQRSRSGSRMMRGFEGGQMPLVRRVPKRGFTNIFRTEYTVVNLSQLEKLDPAATGGDEVTPDLLVARGLARRGRPVRVVGVGEVGRAFKVKAHRFSKSARAKIEAAGGSCEELQA